MSDDHYQTLGVPRTASADDIRKAYRELARKYHPDLHPDDASAKEKFKKVQTAFDVLNDPSKRELYDRYGSSFEGFAPGGGGGWRGGGGPFPGGRFQGAARSTWRAFSEAEDLPRCSAVDGRRDPDAGPPRLPARTLRRR